jgi:hypothetical protein
MSNPRGPRNPKRVRLEKESGADNPELAFRFRDELKTIRSAMGDDAPSQDESVTLFTLAASAISSWAQRCFTGTHRPRRLSASSRLTVVRDMKHGDTERG